MIVSVEFEAVELILVGVGVEVELGLALAFDCARGAIACVCAGAIVELKIVLIHVLDGIVDSVTATGTSKEVWTGRFGFIMEDVDTKDGIIVLSFILEGDPVMPERTPELNPR